MQSIHGETKRLADEYLPYFEFNPLNQVKLSGTIYNYEHLESYQQEK